MEDPVRSVALAAILRAQPGDTVFIESDQHLTDAERQVITEQLHRTGHLDDVKFVLLEGGLHVVKAESGEVRDVKVMGFKWFTEEIAASLGIDRDELHTIRGVTIHADVNSMVRIELRKVVPPVTEAVAS